MGTMGTTATSLTGAATGARFRLDLFERRLAPPRHGDRPCTECRIDYGMPDGNRSKMYQHKSPSDDWELTTARSGDCESAMQRR